MTVPEKYIFTIEDGTHYTGSEITEVAKDCVADGTLSIIRCSDCAEMDEDGEWIPLTPWNW